jgi:hypothetical protein
MPFGPICCQRDRIKLNEDGKTNDGKFFAGKNDKVKKIFIGELLN